MNYIINNRFNIKLMKIFKIYFKIKNPKYLIYNYFLYLFIRIIKIFIFIRIWLVILKVIDNI